MNCGWLVCKSNAPVCSTRGLPAARARGAHVVALLLVVCAALVGPLGHRAEARDLSVSNDADLVRALRDAKRGDAVVIAPGTYKGDLYIQNMDGVTIRSADPANPAVIQGGNRGMQLVGPVDVTLRGLVFTRQLKGGLIIDDGGDDKGAGSRPARGVTIENVRVLGTVDKGNHDGIKLAGVRDVVIRNVVVEAWGTEGSGIDFVGVHNALIENAQLKHPGLAVSGSGIRVKGGSKAVIMRANRIELPIGKGRGLQAGGHTSEEFFRFVRGDTGYEANDVVMEGNVVIGGASAVSWVNIDGGIAHRNLIVRPGSWVIRILNENPGNRFVSTQQGVFLGNRVVFNDTATEFNTAVNVGDETRPETFQFARNIWINIANPTPEGSRPKLPAAEVEGVYGGKPTPSADLAPVWSFPWGNWVVNATAARATVDAGLMKGAKLAVAGPSAKFNPRAEQPLSGDWRLIDPGAGLVLEPMSQAILIITAR